MKSQKRLIHEFDWELLIILDSCRYDFFEKIYSNYLEGRLKKVRSPPGVTDGWLRETFPGYYGNTIYISGNPQVAGLEKWRGNDHFWKVDPVWDYGWEHVDGIPTVPPENVSRAVRRNLMEAPERRMIAHYMQPHAPYIGRIQMPIESLMPWIRRRVQGFGPMSVIRNKAVREILTKVKNSFHPSRLLLRRLGRIVDEVGIAATKLEWPGEDPPTTMGKALRMGMWNINEIKEAYEANLELVLEEVRILIEGIGKLVGDIVITADHGELFGEGGEYGHFAHTTYFM